MKKYRSRKSKNGKGIFSTKLIRKGETIIDFSKCKGTFLCFKDYSKLYDSGFDYDIQIDDDIYFAPINKKQLESVDFVNHSCNPNVGIKDSFKLVAMRNIFPGEEITFDYAMSESSPYKMVCNCGAFNCRKIIKGSDWKLKNPQKRYKEFFSEYIKRKIKKLKN